MLGIDLIQHCIAYLQDHAYNLFFRKTNAAPGNPAAFHTLDVLRLSQSMQQYGEHTCVIVLMISNMSLSTTQMRMRP